MEVNDDNIFKIHSSIFFSSAWNFSNNSLKPIFTCKFKSRVNKMRVISHDFLQDSRSLHTYDYFSPLSIFLTFLLFFGT